MATAAKQYTVLVAFNQTDKKTGDSKRYEPGDTYSGDYIDLYLAGVDDQGPLIGEKNDTNTPTNSGGADSSIKEK
jgi:hypothetical protein